METPNLSINNGSPDWGLHRFEDNVVFHCARNPNGFWTAIGPAKELVQPIKPIRGQIELPVVVNLIEDKLIMSGFKKAFPKDKAEKKASKTEKKSVKTADKKEKKAVKATKKSKKS